ncbi:hypothetical protein [Caulobacter sp. NIBR1757]|uniref:hypothetical protein n=1 Tax=Caulobacter sp. NIBR1757 TaxID=3016000 RepID=UPI0022F0706D|nr:hypothetical protein [Caulobacter sp. NIBR1757]WGM39912.1 hypothetical protein AMEJIAPC_02852 [Caulobacter sp. NIBR1757]
MAGLFDRFSSSFPVAPVLGGLAALTLIAATGSFLLSERQFRAATAEHPWLRHAAKQRTLTDRFRFPLSNTQAVAVALAPAAVAGIEALPLDFSSVETAKGLVASLNDINPACEKIAVAPAQCAEAAVARRQTRLEQTLDLLPPLKADYWIERNGAWLAFSKLIVMSARVCGLTPYRTETALLIKPVDGYGKEGVTGWKRLAPGECKSVEFGKYRRQPKLLAYTKATDDEAIEALRSDARYTAAWGGRNATWGGSGPEAVKACVAAEDADPIPEQCGRFDSPVSFRSVHTTIADGLGQATWLVADPGLCSPDCAWNQPSSEGLIRSLQTHAQQLSSLLLLRKEHHQRYGTTRPYVNGVEAVDDNGPYRAGVRVVSVEPQTPFGVASPFRIGDVITQLAGVPIFSAEDLNLALARFVTSVGADKTYLFQYWRYDEARGQATKYEESATVYFNAGFWLANGYSNREFEAMMHGFGNAVTFGLYRDAICGWKTLLNEVSSFSSCKIAAINKWMLLRQLYPDYYSWGALPAMLFSPLRMLLGVAGITVSMAGQLVIEALEAGLSVASNSAPGQSVIITAGQFTQSIVVGRLTEFGTALMQPDAFQ